MARYRDRIIFVNNSDKWKKALERRGKTRVRQYNTAQLNYPTAQQQQSLEMIGHTWTVGDRFYKLAHEAYGDPELWWVIAWFNKAPTEADVNFGDVIQIPHPLERILQLLDV